MPITLFTLPWKKEGQDIFSSLSFQGMIVHWPCSFEYELYFNGVQLCFCRSVSVNVLDHQLCMNSCIPLSPHSLFFVSLNVCQHHLNCQIYFYTNTIMYFSENSHGFLQWISPCFISNVLCFRCREGVMAGSWKGDCPVLILKFYSNIGLFDVPPTSFKGHKNGMDVCFHRPSPF